MPAEARVSSRPLGVGKGSARQDPLNLKLPAQNRISFDLRQTVPTAKPFERQVKSGNPQGR